MNAREIENSIIAKHTKDLVITECKDGPTWTASHARMDVWCMRRSWSRPCITGYEIKVSKIDFQQDTKWQNYLPLCNQLYFACPKGLIDPVQLPAEAGLIYYINGRLKEVKKPSWREITLPESLVFYILMSRVQVVGPGYHEQTSTREKRLKEWRKWLAEREESKLLGYGVARAVRDHVHRVESQNKHLQNQVAAYESVKAMLDRMGLSWNNWDLSRRVEEAALLIPDDLINNLNSVRAALARLVEDARKRNDEYKKMIAPPIDGDFQI